MNGSRTTRITLNFRLRSLQVSGVTVPIARPFVDYYHPSASPERPACFIDTGSAVSVVSFPLRRELGFSPTRTLSTELRAWNGYACEFGETRIRLFDRLHRRVTAPLPIVGKFLSASVPLLQDHFVILGLNFLMDNAARLEIAGQPWNLAGYIELPVLEPTEAAA